MKKLFIPMLCMVAVLASCAGGKRVLSDPQASKAVHKEMKRLESLRGKVTLFGQQDALSYGMGWSYQKDKSDIKMMTGSHPGVMGWDLAGIEKGWKFNLDTVPFSWIHDNLIWAYQQGAFNTVSCHFYNPVTGKSAWDDNKTPNPTVSEIIPGGKYNDKFKASLDSVAKFLLSLKLPDGSLVPVMFRPLHENDGDWFWWGKMHCTPDQYKALYRFIQEYLTKVKQVHNLIFVYSPDRKFTTEEEYLERYPGDQWVDMIGFDDYWSLVGENPVQELVKRMHIVVSLANKHNKLCALTETGLNKVTDTEWFSGKLLPAIKADKQTRQLLYALVWRNYSQNQYFAPYPGHPAEKDFVKFASDPAIGLLNTVQKYFGKR
jgi:mannan endo-1,4-beta-mannosidase